MTGSCCAYGPLLLLPIFASTAALVMTWVFTFDCRFFQASFHEIIGDETEHGTLSVGLWTVQEYYMYFKVDDKIYYDESIPSGCTGWNQHSFLNVEDYVDGPLRFARVVSMLMSFIPGLMLIFLLCASCMIFSPGAFKGLAWGFGLVGVFCLMCLIALASDLCKNATDCTLERDGIICIFAALIWIIAAVSILYLHPIDKSNGLVAATAAGTAHPIMSNAQTMVPGTEEIKIQEMVASDGTVTVLTTTSLYNANGTMTVTETREVRATAPSA